MALPNPDRPTINTTIETIVEDIQENSAYLDVQSLSFCVKVLKRTVLEGNGDIAVTGVGFEPRAIICMAIGAYGESSVGYYGPSTTFDAFVRYKLRTFISGNFYSDRYISSLGVHSALYYMAYDSYTNLMRGYVYSTNSDGFVWRWVTSRQDIVLDEYYAVLFCIK